MKIGATIPRVRIDIIAKKYEDTNKAIQSYNQSKTALSKSDSRSRGKAVTQTVKAEMNVVAARRNQQNLELQTIKQATEQFNAVTKENGKRANKVMVASIMTADKGRAAITAGRLLDKYA